MLVVGPTGYIGKFVVKELVKRGYNVVAFAREQAGIKGKMSKEDTVKVGAKDRTGVGGQALKHLTGGSRRQMRLNLLVMLCKGSQPWSLSNGSSSSSSSQRAATTPHN